ncbi:MAG: peptidylprolyl isomerase [Saprospiraceae bacterium]|nr:peptidylprolyl isomerase [Saprospiraceae bacterium]
MPIFSRIASTVALCVLLFNACVPPTKKAETPTSVDLSNPDVQKMLTFQNDQNLDSLKSYFSHPSSLLRLMAVNAFASFQDKSVGDSIVLKLKDSNFEVRAAAAYVLGQLGDSTHLPALISAFAGQDSININNQYNANVLEAIGKIGGIREADLLSSVETYRTTDTLLLTGQIKALYRFGLRNIIPQNGVKLSLKYLENPEVDREVKLMCAHYLARTRDIKLDDEAASITKIIANTQDVDIKMALALSLGKCKTQDCKEVLASLVFGNDDYRIRANAVRALTAFLPDQGIADTILTLTTDKDPHVALTAADAVLKIKTPGLISSFWRADSIVENPMIKAKLLQAIMNNQSLFLTVSKEGIKNLALQRKNQATDPFVKAEYIKVLGYDPYQYVNIIAIPTTSKLEEMAKVEALNNIINSPDFIAAYKNNYIKVKREILYYFASKIREGDSGVAAFTAPILADEKNQAKTLLRDSTFLEESMSKMVQPRDLETVIELNKLSKYLFDTTYTEQTSKVKALNFNTLSTLMDSAEVVVKTTKGNITIMLYPRLAPATVSNFLELCKSDYFDDKIFHRVVPNFVIQTGCPRGDGFGSMDYTIRSELGRKSYNEAGYVGMASAGLHTESSQFFITHSPTPHLDGRYTLFGKVIKGMDVVHQIVLGDKIIDAILSK